MSRGIQRTDHDLAGNDEGDARPDQIRSRQRPFVQKEFRTPKSERPRPVSSIPAVNTTGPIVDLTPGSISIAVDRLVAKGLVDRVREPRRPTRSDRSPHLTWQGSHCFRLSKAFWADEESVLPKRISSHLSATFRLSTVDQSPTVGSRRHDSTELRRAG
jgi:hypothetical protein